MENLKKYSEYFIYFCGILLFASVLLVSAEVFLRKFFLISFGGADELSGYVLGISITWSLAYVLIEKMHIRIDIVYNKVTQSFQMALDVLALAFTLIFVSFLTYYASTVLFTSIEKNSTANTPLGTPLWIPQSIWTLGLYFFLLVIAVLTFKAIKSMITKKSNGYTDISKDVT